MLSLPLVPPLAFFLVSFVALVVLGMKFFRARQDNEFNGIPITFLAAWACAGPVAYFLLFGSGVTQSSLAAFLLLFAVYMAVLGYFMARSDGWSDISIVFRIAPFVGVVGLLFIALGAMVAAEMGVVLLSAGLVLGVLGCWTAADSGIRGFRFFFGGVVASFSAPAFVLQQTDSASFIVLLASCLLPLFSLQKAARRKIRRIEVHEFERKGDLGNMKLSGGTEEDPEEVVVVKRKPKRSKRKLSRSRSSTPDRPVIISREEEVEEEGVPFFGEGVLATEPGRKGDVEIDPWTGAAAEKPTGDGEAADEFKFQEEDEDFAFEEMSFDEAEAEEVDLGEYDDEDDKQREKNNG